MSTVTVLSVTPASSCDCRLRIDVAAEPREFVARRVASVEGVPGIGELEPWRPFLELPLDIDQLRALVRLVVAVHEGGSPSFPIVLGLNDPL
jgi:hypothetical protein